MPESNRIVLVANQFVALRDQIEELEADLSRLKAQRDAKELQLIQEMDSLDMTSIGLKDVGKISQISRVYGGISDDEAARDFFEEEGVADQMYKQAVDKSRLNSFVRELVKSAKAVPECLNVTVKVGLQLRRVKI